MKVVVVKTRGEDLVCPKSSFMEDDSGILRLVQAWKMTYIDFKSDTGSYRVDSDSNPVWSCRGKKRDGAKPKLLINVSVKDYMYYYEDEILPLAE